MIRGMRWRSFHRCVRQQGRMAPRRSLTAFHLLWGVPTRRLRWRQSFCSAVAIMCSLARSISRQALVSELNLWGLRTSCDVCWLRMNGGDDAASTCTVGPRKKKQSMWTLQPVKVASGQVKSMNFNHHNYRHWHYFWRLLQLNWENGNAERLPCAI